MKRSKHKARSKQSKAGLSGSSAQGSQSPHTREAHRESTADLGPRQEEKSEPRAPAYREEKNRTSEGVGRLGERANLVDGNGGDSGPTVSEVESVAALPLSRPPNQTDDTRARAREVDHTSHRARVAFCRTLKGQYVKGETHKVLAEVWGLAPSTVTRDLSIAFAEIQEAADPNGVDVAIWYRDMHDLLDVVMKDRATIDAGTEQYFDKTTGKLAVEPIELNFIAQAKSKPVEQAMKLLENLGRALGIQSTNGKPDISVNIAILGEKEELSSADAFAITRVVMELPPVERAGILEKAMRLMGRVDVVEGAVG